MGLDAIGKLGQDAVELNRNHPLVQLHEDGLEVVADDAFVRPEGMSARQDALRHLRHAGGYAAVAALPDKALLVGLLGGADEDNGAANISLTSAALGLVGDVVEAPIAAAVGLAHLGAAAFSAIRSIFE